MASGDKAIEKLTPDDYRKRLWKHKEQFKLCLEYGYGLNDRLVSMPCRLISDKEVDKLSQQSLTTMQLNKKLLKFIHKKTKVEEFNKFMTALDETLQSHLKEVIYKNGNFTAADKIRPLTPRERTCLTGQQVNLVHSLHTEVPEILDRLLAQNCVNEEHRATVIEKNATKQDKARKLLEIVRNRSFDQFSKFRLCLKEIKSQAYALTNIEGEEGVLDLDSTNSSTEDVSSLEDTVSRKFFDNSSNKSYSSEISSASSQSLTARIRQRIVALFRSNSIRVCISYPSVQFLKEIRQCVEDGSMKTLLQELFNELLVGKTLTVNIVHMVDYSRQEFYLKCAAAGADFLDPASNHPLLRNGAENMANIFTNQMVQKVKERILKSAFAWKIKEGSKLTSRPDLEAFECLSSVCRDWCKTARSEVLKAEIRTARDDLKRTHGLLKPRCEKAVPMPGVSCVTSSLDDIYIASSREPNQLFMLKQPPSTSSGKRIPTEWIPREDLIPTQIGDNLDIVSMEPAGDGSGIFCINRSDGVIWFWTKGEARNMATAQKQFSASSGITISPKNDLRIVILKDKRILEMHNLSSELIQIMPLPDYVRTPHAVVCNNEGNIITSFGSEPDETHRVIMINRRGKIDLSYGDECGNGYEQLNNPSSITLDQEDDILYVADKGNGRILALDKNLELINVVLDSKYDQIGDLSFVHYSKITRQLVVVHGDTVSLYKVHRARARRVAQQ